MSKKKTNDTLNVQIDKLSEAIESMMKEFNTLQTPRVLNPEITRSKPQNSIHIGLTGDEDLSDPDSFCKDPDALNLELWLDRVSMTCEDFRSFEARKIENSHEEAFQSPWQISRVLELICARVQERYNVSLPFSDLEDFIESLFKVIEKQIECNLIDVHGFILSLCDVIQTEKPGSHRLKIGDSFLDLSIKERPRNRFQKSDFSANYEAVLEKILNDKDLPEEVKSIVRVKKNYLVSLDLEKVANMSVDTIKEDLAQQLAEVNLTKKKVVNQLESLSKFSKALRSKDIDLIKLQEKIETEKEYLENERRHLEESVITHSKKIQEIKIKIGEVCPELSYSIEVKSRSSLDQPSGRPNSSLEVKSRSSIADQPTGRLSPLIASIRASTPVSGTRPDPDEMALLQNELAELEALPQDSSTQLKINRLKTQISAVRSATAINNSLRNSTGTLPRLSDHKRNSSNGSTDGIQISPSPFPRSGCSSPTITSNNDTALGQNMSLKRTTPRPPAPGPRKGPPVKKEPDELELVMNQLKLQESRLKEREEMVQEKENRLHRNWMKVPNGNELVGLVQKELNYLQVIKKEYEDKFDELNNELSIFSVKNKEVKMKERELENRMIENGKDRKGLEDEKRNMEGKLESIMMMIEGL